MRLFQIIQNILKKEKLFYIRSNTYNYLSRFISEYKSIKNTFHQKSKSHKLRSYSKTKQNVSWFTVLWVKNSFWLDTFFAISILCLSASTLKWRMVMFGTFHDHFVSVHSVGDNSYGPSLTTMSSRPSTRPINFIARLLITRE